MNDVQKKLLFTITLLFVLTLPSLVCAQSVSQNIHVSDSYRRSQLTIFTLWFVNGTILGNHLIINDIPVNNSAPWTFNYVASNDITSAMNTSVVVTRSSFPSNITATFTNTPPIIIQAGNNDTLQLNGSFETNGTYTAGAAFSYFFDVTVTCVDVSSGSSYHSTFTIYGNTTYPLPSSSSPTPTPSPTPTESPTPTPPTSSPSPTAQPTTSMTTQPAATTNTNPSSTPPSATNTLNESTTDPTPSPTPSIPEFSTGGLVVLLLAALPALVAIIKKSSKTKPAVALLVATVLLCTCIIQVSSGQTAVPMQIPSNVKFILMYYNGTAFPTGDANAAGFTYGEMYLNVGGIMTSASNYGSLFVPETNLVVLRNDGDTSIIVNATLKNVNVPANIEVMMLFRPISVDSYSSVSNHWIGHENSTATNPVAPAQYMYLGLQVILSQSNNAPSGTPTFNFNYSYDIEITATQAF